MPRSVMNLMIFFIILMLLLESELYVRLYFSLKDTVLSQLSIKIGLVVVLQNFHTYFSVSRLKKFGQNWFREFLSSNPRTRIEFGLAREHNQKFLLTEEVERCGKI
jgi:hypothetical protein